MSIYKINNNLPNNDKIEALNDMVLEVNGKVEQGKFNKNEIDEIYDEAGLTRQYTRNSAIGNTLSTYTDWTHYNSEVGYSIWKINVSDYAYNANNQLYFDDKLVEFRGVAATAAATTFSHVYLYDGSSYISNTSEAGLEGGTAFDLMDDTDQYLYVGMTTATFSGIKFEFMTRGSNYTLVVEYWNGSSWTTMSSASDDLTDDTSEFISDGSITWTSPTAWSTCSINSQTAYWIRLSTSTVPVTMAEAYYVIPSSSVIGLLALSSSQVLNEEWAWCNCGQYIYVTIKNTGPTAYEGNTFITSSSSSTNLQNFFIYNHEFKMDYQKSSFYGDSVSTRSGVAVGNLVYISDDYSFDNATANSFAKRAVGVLTAAGQIKYLTGLVQNVNTVGSSNIRQNDILYLSGTAGKVTKTSPSGAGKIQQKVGIAINDELSGSKVDMLMMIDINPTILTT